MRLRGLSWAITRVPGGAIVDLLKSYGQYSWTYAEIVGLNLKLLTIFMMIKHLENIWFHFMIKKTGSLVENTELK